MSEQQYEVYIETVLEQGRRHAAVTWFMGWLAGFTESGGSADEESVEAAKKKAEELYNVQILVPFGPSETPREEK